MWVGQAWAQGVGGAGGGMESVFLIVAMFSFFWLEKFFARGLADLRPLFEWMPRLLIILVSALGSTMFLGGWLPPIDSYVFNLIPGWIWLGLKVFVIATLFLWVRATFPRFRYDQIMRLGWKIFIPVTLVWLVVVGAWIQTPWNIWK